MNALENRYARNRIYLSQNQQSIIQNTPILLAGCGIGSVIAECALRMGFENLTIIDGDQVELSNLNRQNYVEKDISIPKVQAIKDRLLSINSSAKINIHNCYLTEENINQFIAGHKIAINALDFSSNVPLLFDKMCKESDIPILHPYNLGWGGIVAVISPKGIGLDSVTRDNKEFNEVEFVEYALSHLDFWGKPQGWAKDILKAYLAEEVPIPPPQLSVGAWLIASMCTTILFDLAIGTEVKIFPNFYFNSIK